MFDESVGELSMLSYRLQPTGIAEMFEKSVRELCVGVIMLFHLAIMYTNTLKL